MAPLLYKADVSAPCRSVMMTAKALELELDFKDINMLEKEHLEADFIEINPQHSVPVLDDDGFVICDSHAILLYLVRKYGADDSLYPDDIQQRALIDHRLFFNAGTLQSLTGQILRPIFMDGEKHISEQLVDRVIEVYGFMESFLQDREWFAGDSVTLADLSMIPTVTTLNILIPIDSDIYPKINEWIARAEELPYYETNSEGLDQYRMIYEAMMAS